jgi:hypothetical protein
MFSPILISLIIHVFSIGSNDVNSIKLILLLTYFFYLEFKIMEIGNILLITLS